MEPITDQEMLRLKPLYDKWQNAVIPAVIPSDLFELIELELKTTKYLFSSLVSIYEKFGLGSKEQAEGMIAAFNQNLEGSSIGLVILGLELAERMKHPHDSPTADQPIALKLDFEEWGVIMACIGVTCSRILAKEDITKRPLTRQEKATLKRLEEVRDIIREQAEKSSEVISVEALKDGLDSAKDFQSTLIRVLSNLEAEIEEYITSLN